MICHVLYNCLRVWLKSYNLYRQNEMGTPYCVVADEKVLETGIVRLQDRDTTIQVQLKKKM